TERHQIGMLGDIIADSRATSPGIRTQDLIEVEIADRDKGRAGLFRRHRKARVVGRDKHLAQIAVGVGDGRDAGHCELLGQAVLKRAERPLRAAPRLWRKRWDVLDAELCQGPADPRFRWGRLWVRA